MTIPRWQGEGHAGPLDPLLRTDDGLVVRPDLNGLAMQSAGPDFDGVFVPDLWAPVKQGFVQEENAALGQGGRLRMGIIYLSNQKLN